MWALQQTEAGTRSIESGDPSVRVSRSGRWRVEWGRPARHRDRSRGAGRAVDRRPKVPRSVGGRPWAAISMIAVRYWRRDVLRAIKPPILRSDLMKRRLPSVFAGLLATFAAAAALAQGPVALDPAKLKLASANALVLDATDNRAVYSKFADDVTPIASLTKLMTAIVTLEGGQSLDEPIAIDMDDFDYVKGTRSRLRMGIELTRREMLRLALMSSENRAASSLARSYPGGTPAFVAAMNAKAEVARDDAHPLCRSDRPLARERVDGAGPRPRRRCRGPVPADPRVQHDRQPLRRGRPERPPARASTTRTTSSRTASGTSSSRRRATSGRRASAS